MVCLQDTHFQTADEGFGWLLRGMGQQSHACWQGTGFFAPTTSANVGGTAILFNRSFPGKLRGEPVLAQGDDLGRLLRVDFDWGDDVYSLFSVYAPAQPQQRREFFSNFLQPSVAAAMRRGGPGSPGKGAGAHHLLLGGDWNCCASSLDYTGGDRGGAYPQLRSVESAADLVDPYRRLYPHAGPGECATHVSRSHPGSVARLDRWLVSSAACRGSRLLGAGTSCCPASDHHGATVTLTALAGTERGPGFWSMPLHVLDDPGWKGEVEREIRARFQGPPETTRRDRWDNFKTWLQYYTQTYCRVQRWQRRRRVRDLEFRAQQALRDLAGDPGALPGYLRALGELRALHAAASHSAAVQAGVIWQDYGERPTHFFHQIARWRATDSTFHAVQPARAGSEKIPFSLEDRPWAMDAVTQHFAGDAPEGLFRDRRPDPEVQARVLAHCGDVVSPQGARACLGPAGDGRLALIECKEALWDLARGKRPGTDGIPPEFYRMYWEELGQELCAVLNEAFDDLEEFPRLSRSQRRGFTVLIYKGKGDRDSVVWYRPITLLNADYKILAKALAKRLGLALVDLIHPTQTAFVPDRWIGENILAHLDECDALDALRGAIPAALFFSDLEKAYDRTDRAWVRLCLTHMGFPPPFVRWVDILLRDNVNQMLVNGFIGREFPVLGGLRQGCPISPPLYVVASQPLATLVRHLVAVGDIRPIPWPGPQPLEPLWQHADDCVLHLHPDSVGAALHLAMEPYCAASGQALNLSKCTVLLYGGSRLPSVEDLGVAIAQRGQVVRHLGVPLGQSIDPATYVGPVVEAMGRRAAWWSSVRLSFLGRVYVAKQELASRLVHIMTFAPLPEALLTKAQSILRAFVASGTAFGGRRHYPGVGTLGLDWSLGGCRATDLQSVSVGLLGKIAARLMHPRVEPWKPLMVQWWSRGDGWYAAVPGARREVDAWGFGADLPLTTYPLSRLRDQGVPPRVLSYIRAFRDLQPHWSVRAARTPRLLLRRQLIFHNPLIPDEEAGPLSSDHHRWGPLASRWGVRRVGELLETMRGAPGSPEKIQKKSGALPRLLRLRPASGRGLFRATCVVSSFLPPGCSFLLARGLWMGREFFSGSWSRLRWPPLSALASWWPRWSLTSFGSACLA